MNTADLIGFGYPQTLPEAQKEIARLRGLAREWMAFGGEAIFSSNTIYLDQVVIAIRGLGLSNVSARNAARVMFAMSSRCGRVWSREMLADHVYHLAGWHSWNSDPDGVLCRKYVDVLLCDARKVLTHLGVASALRNVFGRGWILETEGWAAVQALVIGGDA